MYGEIIIHHCCIHMDANLEHVRSLGRGAFGTTQLVRHRVDGGMYALKTVSCARSKQLNSMMLNDALGEADAIARMTREIRILRQLDHANVVSYVWSWATPQDLMIVMEYVDGGTLDALIRRRLFAPVVQSPAFLRQLLGAVAYVHASKILHRDIKADNVLLTLDMMVCKLADFGQATIVDPVTNQYFREGAGGMGAVSHRSPEVVAGKPYGYKSDVWAVGCVALEMVLGTILVDEGPDLDLSEYVAQAVEDQSDAYPTVVGALPRLLAVEPHMRGEAGDVLRRMDDMEAAHPTASTSGTVVAAPTGIARKKSIVDMIMALRLQTPSPT